MKIIVDKIVISFMVFILLACGPIKKVNKINKIITVKADTLQPVIHLKENGHYAIDSISLLENKIISLMDSNTILFNTFQAKAKITLAVAKQYYQANLFVRIKKDSLIWMMLSGPLSIEVFRIKISPDSIWIMNKLARTIDVRSIKSLQSYTGIPLSFNEFQNMLIGNPVYINNPVKIYATGTNQYAILFNNGYLRNIITYDLQTHTILSSNMDASDPTNTQQMDITFDKYNFSNTPPFADNRHITLSLKNSIDIYLDIKEFEWNNALNFPFAIPKGFVRVQQQ
ncbi:MAG: DUF4292 domain-containing protein [Phycisphaerales bacterium]|nr:DUF4292 domain-containing protein [Phycisphaerales bacterium]